MSQYMTTDQKRMSFFYQFSSYCEPFLSSGGPVFDSTIRTSPTSPVDNDWWASVSLDYYGTEKNAFFPIFKIFGYFLVLRGHAHQIPRTAMFKLGELSLFLQFLLVQPMHDPWHDPTKLLEKKPFFLDTASILEAYCSQTNKATYLNLGSFQRSASAL